ncbi:MAG: YeeE/YedE family protein [Chloroflexota bacterium]
MNTLIRTLGYDEGIVLPYQVRSGLLYSFGALVILILIGLYDDQMALFWAFGIAFGFVLQRSRFCFASAFRDVFLLRHGRSMRGVLAGLAIATLGFAAMMSKQVPNPSLGILPPDANVLPLGWHLIIGGVMFGVGMVVAGGCVSGSIYRMGEGYVASWVSFGGIMIGTLAAAYTWNWWWDWQIADGARLWLPTYFGHGGGIALTLLALLFVYLAVIWWESQGGLVMPDMPIPTNDEETFAAKLENTWKRFFVHGWSAAAGGIALGGLNVLLFIVAQPWGFTGEVSRWMVGITNWLNIGPGELKGAADLPGCTLDLGDGSVLHFMLFLVLGMVAGSFLAAVFSGEFKIRVPQPNVRNARYGQALGGGVIMGYGAAIGMGCTIGSFFSAIPSLAINGWVFAVCLAIGAWVGTQVIQRIP